MEYVNLRIKVHFCFRFLEKITPFNAKWTSSTKEFDEEDDIGDYERKRLQNIEERKEKFNNLRLKQLKKSCSNNLKKKSEVSTSNTTNNVNLQGVKLFDTLPKYVTFYFSQYLLSEYWRTYVLTGT